VKTVTGSNSESYTYDQNGNRTNSGYVTAAGNRLIEDGTYNYTYDAEGNRSTRTKIADGSVDEYTWDYRNRLMGIVTKDLDGVVTRSVGYTYDVDDLRVSKTVDGAVENYYLDRNQIAFVTDGGGNETEHYLYGLNVDQVLAQDSATGMIWALADRLGSVDTLTDAVGNVVDERTFDSFGRLISETNPAVSFRYGYTGRELDAESGLDYYRARYYDSSVGRFISTDPMGFGAGDTNLYRYVGNNSTNNTDPTGMISWNDVQQGWNNFTQGVAQGTTSFRDTVTSNAQRGLEYWAGVAVAGQNEGGIIGDYKQRVGTVFGLLSSLATEDNIDRASGVLASSLLLPAATTWAAATTVGRAILAIPGVVPATRIWAGMQGIEHGSQQVGQAWSGVGEDGRKLSTPERWITGFNGLLAIGASVFDLSRSIKSILPTRGSTTAQISEYDGRMYALPRDRSGNRLTQYGTGGGGYRNGDTGVHNQLSPVVNRASGNGTSAADGRIQSHHGVQTKSAREWAARNGITLYNPDQAPTVLLSTAPGQPHALINQMQRAAGHGNGETLRQTFNRGYRELIAAGVDRKLANKAMKENYKHYTNLVEEEIAARPRPTLSSLKDNFDSLQ
jgi:RHS repeat-associated protein